MFVCNTGEYIPTITIQSHIKIQLALEIRKRFYYVLFDFIIKIKSLNSVMAIQFRLLVPATAVLVVCIWCKDPGLKNKKKIKKFMKWWYGIREIGTDKKKKKNPNKQ